MVLNILTLEVVKDPTFCWFLAISLGFFIAVFCLLIADQISECGGSGVVIFLILTCVSFSIYIPIILPSLNNKQKQYDEWYTNYHEEVLYDKIYSLELQDSISGSFILGTGKISTDSYYYFYVGQENEPGTYKLAKIEANDNVYIREVETDFNVIAFNRENSDKLEYYINVPKGSITVLVTSPIENNLVYQ